MAPTSTYSNIAIVKIDSKEQQIVAYPNPVKRSESLQLSLQNITASKIEIINSLGQVVYSNSAKQTGSIGIPVSSVLAPGQYVVRIVSEDKVHTQKLLIKE
jgi:Secretion system C-terminal sorting domain